MGRSVNCPGRSLDLQQEMYHQGWTAAQVCWNSISEDELPSIMRCLPDVLRSDQKHEGVKEECRG